MLDYRLEEEARAAGFHTVCGVDEAGRGCLCGPVCAAAVILPAEWNHPLLNDSKKLTPKKRDLLFDEIKENAVAYAVGWGTVEEIDEINILNAAMLAMRRAIAGLPIAPDFALVDGNIARDFPIPAKPVIGGDGISPSIAAASILAKVSRDRLCEEMERDYPGYGIGAHKGYCTKVHREALLKLGAAPIHRKTFLKKILGE
ncbi:MAG: ribonuclease HII [Clostridia bacterium]|nr:ribonuclease HII [Clostridia bacterium]